jgi:ribosomal protein L21E
MTKLIKKSEQQVVEFKIGDVVSFNQSFHDGRSYEVITTTGTVVKVNRVTVDVETPKGNVYRVDKDKFKK